ncbi:MAG: TrpR-like protein YerC/YecD [Oscillospiraceae bacterium]|nr:TrpR-like protein YerC/YecD [Oscillospiraceae bacterium]
MHSIHAPEVKALFEAIVSLETPEECGLFFEDICTVKEVQAMAQRLAVAKALDAGQNYNEVCAETGASSATISRVNRCLLYGGGGYRTVLRRMKEKQNET